MVGSGVPALHQIVARAQAVRADGIRTLGVVHDRLDSRVGACHLRPNPIKTPRREQARPG
jgi:hypothetical protein